MQFRVARAYNFFACQNIGTAAVVDFSFNHTLRDLNVASYRDILAISISDINIYLRGTIFKRCTKPYIRLIASVIPDVKISLNNKIL